MPKLRAPKLHSSFRIKPELGEKIEALAFAIDRPKTFIVEQALEEYLAREAWQIQAIKEGITAADAGDLISDEEVGAWIDSLSEHSPPKTKVRGRRHAAKTNMDRSRKTGPR